MSDAKTNISGEENTDQLKDWAASSQPLFLSRSAVLRFIDRFLTGSLNATQLQELADLLECDNVDYDDEEGDPLIPQVLFEMATPEANRDIDRQAAERWRQMLLGDEPEHS